MADFRHLPGTVFARVALVRASGANAAEAAAREFVRGLLLAWANHTTGGLAVIAALGGHASMLQQLHVPNREMPPSGDFRWT
jgi:hypothetical protein